MRIDELEKLDGAIRQVVESHGDKLVGRLFVMSLDAVRQRYGNTWHYVAEKAQRTARAHITQGLGPEDVVVPVGEVDFVVGILSTSKREAAARALRVDQGVSYAVTGEDLGILGVSAKQVEPAEDGTLTFRPLSYADLERGESQQSVTIDLEAELADDEEEDDSFPTIDVVLEALTFRIQPIVRLTDQSIQFERLAAFAAPLGPESDEWTIMENFPDSKVRAKMDLKALKACRAHLRRLGAARNGRRIVVPVFFETLANNYTRGLFLKIVQRIPQPARRLLAFHVSGVPAGVAQSRLAELAAVIKPFSSGCFLGVPPQFTGFDALRDLVLIGLTVEGAEADEADAILSAAYQAGIPTWVMGLAAEPQRQSALGLGATFGSGPLFPSDVDDVDIAAEA